MRWEGMDGDDEGEGEERGDDIIGREGTDDDDDDEEEGTGQQREKG
jgi:hypothetical protein